MMSDTLWWLFGDQFLRLIGLAILFGAIEAFLGARKKRSSETRVNLLFFFTNGIVGKFLVLGMFASEPLRPLLYGGAGSSGSMPIISGVLAFVLIDAASYWRHRLVHTKPLWAIHFVHHSSSTINWTSSFRLHPLNVLINRGFDLVVLLALPLDPQTVSVIYLVRSLYTTFIHSNINVRWGFLERLLVTPDFHRVHHSVEHGGSNFGFVFTVWDRIFGTYRGAEGDLSSYEGRLRDRYFGLLAHPFRVWLSRTL